MTTATILRLHHLARRQHGVLTRTQAIDAGATHGQIHRLRAAGALEAASTGVYRLPGARTWLQDMAVALLAAGAGARASHRAAARLLGLESFDRAPVEVVIAHDRRVDVEGAVLHRSTDLAGEVRVRRQGLWLTNATRTLVDLGSVVSEAQLEVALDDALRLELTTYDRLWAGIARLGRPGRSGVPQLRDLLISRGDVAGLTDTGFETLVLRALREHGLPRPTTQHELFDDEGRFVMRFDAAYVPEKVGIEATASGGTAPTPDSNRTASNGHVPPLSGGRSSRSPGGRSRPGPHGWVRRWVGRSRSRRGAATARVSGARRALTAREAPETSLGEVGMGRVSRSRRRCRRRRPSRRPTPSPR